MRIALPGGKGLSEPRLNNGDVMPDNNEGGKQVIIKVNQFVIILYFHEFQFVFTAFVTSLRHATFAGLMFAGVAKTYISDFAHTMMYLNSKAAGEGQVQDNRKKGK